MFTGRNVISKIKDRIGNEPFTEIEILALRK
jgi:hypothetical protein